MTELECKTADLWLKQGTIQIESMGAENTYYTDEFDQSFFCKNYPNPLGLTPEQLATFDRCSLDSWTNTEYSGTCGYSRFDKDSMSAYLYESGYILFITFYED